MVHSRVASQDSFPLSLRGIALNDCLQLLCDPSDLGNTDICDRSWLVQNILLHSDWSRKIQILLFPKSAPLQGTSQRRLYAAPMHHTPSFSYNTCRDFILEGVHTTPISEGIMHNFCTTQCNTHLKGDCVWPPHNNHFRRSCAQPMSPISEGLNTTPSQLPFRGGSVQPLYKCPFPEGFKQPTFQRGLCTALMQLCFRDSNHFKRGLCAAPIQPLSQKIRTFILLLAKISLHLTSHPIRVALGKHDAFVQIRTFHTILAKTFGPLLRPNTYTPIGVVI